MILRFKEQCIGPQFTVGRGKLADVPDDVAHWYLDREYADPPDVIRPNELPGELYAPVVMSDEYAARFRKAHLGVQ